VIRCEGDSAECDFLDESGVRPGASLTVLAAAENGLLLKVGEEQISLAGSLAESILVEPEDIDP
jgi:Fe2+ transport system protein FeoA